MEEQTLTENEKQQIMENHTSICYGCNHARRPASIENAKKGYVGCSARCHDKDWNIVKEGKEVAEGWVDLSSGVFGEKSGMITNYQLLTLEIKKCSFYTNKNY